MKMMRNTTVGTILTRALPTSPARLRSSGSERPPDSQSSYRRSALPRLSSPNSPKRGAECCGSGERGPKSWSARRDELRESKSEDQVLSPLGSGPGLLSPVPAPSAPVPGPPRSLPPSQDGSPPGPCSSFPH